jgi:hypothetical protein
MRRCIRRLGPPPLARLWRLLRGGNQMRQKIRADAVTGSQPSPRDMMDRNETA